MERSSSGGMIDAQKTIMRLIALCAVFLGACAQTPASMPNPLGTVPLDGGGGDGPPSCAPTGGCPYGPLCGGVCCGEFMHCDFSTDLCMCNKQVCGDSPGAVARRCDSAFPLPMPDLTTHPCASSYGVCTNYGGF
jgi:hypothetical protein